MPNYDLSRGRKQCRDCPAETIRALRLVAGHEDSEATLAGMVNISALVEGLMIRAIRNLNIDWDFVVRIFRHVVSNLLTHTTKSGMHAGSSLKELVDTETSHAGRQ